MSLKLAAIKKTNLWTAGSFETLH